MAMILDFFGNVFGYAGNYVVYYFFSALDLVWKPVAMIINGILGLLESIFNLVLTLFAWSNVTFSYFMVALLLIFLFGLIIKIFLWLKDIIGHWV